MKDTIESFESNNSNETERFLLPYRRGVGLMVINQKKEIFVGKRIDAKYDTWQMPQGGIKEDETVSEAGLRELKEETNIVDVKIIHETKNWLYYDLPEFLTKKLWAGQYRGQKQKWLLMYFFGSNSSINVNTVDAEFQEWKWINLSMIPNIVIPFKKHLYSSVVREFYNIIRSFQT